MPMGRMRGTETSVSSARPDTDSLRTTIPVFVAKRLDLAAKDRLDWEIDKMGDEWVAVVRKKA